MTSESIWQQHERRIEHLENAFLELILIDGEQITKQDVFNALKKGGIKFSKKKLDR